LKNFNASNQGIDLTIIKKIDKIVREEVGGALFSRKRSGDALVWGFQGVSP